jgi:hypothetical protein
MRKQLIPFIAATLSAACVLTSPGAAFANPTFSFAASGSNMLNISDFTVETYASGLQIANIGDATRTGDTFGFPIVGGAVDAESIDLESVSVGGMKITNGKDVITLDAPIVNTIGSQPIMTFLVTVNGTLQGRYEVFNLKVPAYPKPQTLSVGETVKAANIMVSLNAQGATLFNSTLGTNFTAGQSVGTLKVKTVLSKKLPG